MLTQAELDYRRDKVTGSLVTAIMNAKTQAELVKIWRIKVGLDDDEPPSYAMRLGSYMEQFLLDENQAETGRPITRRGEIVDHPTIPGICAKLDGYRAFDDAVLECKFLSPFRKREELIPYYYWQATLQQLCVGAQRAILLVGQGTAQPVEHELMYDQHCVDVMMERVVAFISCIRTFTPPYIMPTPPPPDRWRTVDVVAHPTNWSEDLLAHLDTYGVTKDAADAHEKAGKSARALVPADVGKLYAGPWQITRDRRNALRIKNRGAPDNDE